MTGRNKPAVDNWFKSLSSGSKPLSLLAKKVPIFNKREEVLTTLCEHGVTAARDEIRRDWSGSCSCMIGQDHVQGKPSGLR